MIKGIIFDMDGVLVDAKDWHYEALNRALSECGYEVISREAHLSTYDGLPTRKKLEKLSMELDLPSNLHNEINQLKQHYTMELIEKQCKPSSSHQFALSVLKAEGYQLAVASNSMRKTIEIMMNKTCLAPYFDFILSNEDVINPKPSPEIYEKAILRMQLEPEECLIVEDNEHGIQAAIASEAHVLIVNDVHDVVYQNIKNYIRKIHAKGKVT